MREDQVVSRDAQAMAPPCLAASAKLWLDRFDINRSCARRRLLIGSGPRAQKVLSSFSYKEREAEFVGFLDTGPDSTNKNASLGVPHLGNVEALNTVLDSYAIDQIIVALPINMFYLKVCRTSGICDHCKVSHVSPRQVTTLCCVRSAAATARAHICRNGRNKPRGVNIFFPADVNSLVKMLEDKLIAALGFALLFPLFVIVGISIKIDSPGHVLFRQPRYGYRNELINMYKFRTMYAHQGDPEGTHLTKRADKRITRVGRFLRRTSLDELPQLLNVLRGDMSVVGPRPHARAASAAGIPYEKTMEDYALRHCIKPGITGWAQVNGWRGETETLEQIWNRVAHDIYYVENWSLRLDIKIILRTVGNLLRPPKNIF